ncbi:hypothetical protein EI983_00020 (plasmid) [Roseovarius faecimaris]|uniref:Uncharacterized protein n=1 Tax=Roseovarius faecimaris TaxID=2494550 RepID=A0A6I6IKC6_9RHOB|nr:hypothetical protein [Roseovarius faecimaris]QGX96742.1 hypothetical protein EI983_00020 [Roseovarius faecimaris]
MTQIQRSCSAILATALALSAPLSSQADEVLPDDAIVQGRLCVGSTCANGEPFAGLLSSGYAKFKGSTPALEFEDTSTSSPTTDWRLSAGFNGEDTFQLQDIDVGSIPLQISAGAPSNSLFLAPDGSLGMGTKFPFRDLHIRKLDTPGIRLDQIGQGEAPPQNWEVFANDVLLAFKDFTQNTIPLGIAAGAPDDVVFLTDTGLVGMGTDLPSTGLHVQKSDGTGAILIEETSAGTLGQMTLRNNGITFFRLEDTSIAAGDNTGRAWNFQNQAGTFRITTAPGGPGEIEMIMTPAGDMTIKGSLTTGGGTCGGGCDAVFSDDYELPTIAEHQAQMWAAGHLPNVGPTVENAPINVSDKLGRMLNELEHAHIYIGQLHEQLEAQDALYQQQIAALTARLDALDAQ